MQEVEGKKRAEEIGGRKNKERIRRKVKSGEE